MQLYRRFFNLKMFDLKMSDSTIHQLAVGLNVSERTLTSWNKSFKINLIPNAEGVLCYNEKQKKIILEIHHLIQVRGFTIAGAKAELKKPNLEHKKAETIEKLTEIRDFLEAFRDSFS